MAALDGAPEASPIARRDNPLRRPSAPRALLAGAILCQEAPSLVGRNGPDRERRSDLERARRSPDRRRRRQRHRDRPRCRRARAPRAAVRAGRPRRPHLLGEQQADPRRAALPRAAPVPAGARGAPRARGAAARRAAHHLAVALRPAARRRAAAGVADPPRPLPLRPSRRARAAAGLAGGRPHHRPGRPAAQAGVQEGLRLRRLLGRRRPARGAERARCRRARRGDPDPHPLHGGAARERHLVRRCSTPAAAARPLEVRARALVNATGPWVVALPRRAAADVGPEPRAPGQGRPRRSCPGSTTTPIRTSCRTTTAAWSS